MHICMRPAAFLFIGILIMLPACAPSADKITKLRSAAMLECLYAEGVAERPDSALNAWIESHPGQSLNLDDVEPRSPSEDTLFANLAAMSDSVSYYQSKCDLAQSKYRKVLE